MSFLLEPSSRKRLDFEINFDDNKYSQVMCYFYRHSVESSRLPKYPYNCSHFISTIDYGVALWVKFSKADFPNDEALVRLITSILI